MVQDDSRAIRDGIQQSIINKSARITLKVAGKLMQFSLRIVSNGPEFKSHFCLVGTTYWTTLLALDVRSLIFYILLLLCRIRIFLSFSPHAIIRVQN